ncbi:cathepsin l [Stylonychia lemnae]|uniref:Cathepsin l n=1 Tax=Stylonychia lemnae TaxID=5949 RepID=A0A078AKR1_STYLE|nr:cathepsin l [Stylonychia lemnae]|eukprot:CDW82799.1 cathepsin l [Stylonychia lemnae]
MRKTTSITLAVVGVVAFTALFAVSGFNGNDSQLNQVFSPEDQEFLKFITLHGKSYATKEEFQFRQNLFKSNLLKIRMHNAQNGVSYRLGVNKFSDMTPEEYKKRLGYLPHNVDQSKVKYLAPSNGDNTIDWRTKGAVTQVKDQGQCGSCWSFSATGSIEGHNFLTNKQLVSLSEQQLVDCSQAQGNEGCNGGWMDSAFQYAEQTPLETEADYPYEGVDDTCRVDASKETVQVKSYVDVTPNDADQLIAALQLGPVSVAIEADQNIFQSYQGGVINDSSCGTELDHGVLAVGYGTDGGVPYFIVKNSWGPDWGDQGYVKIAATNDNICGILSQPSYPEIVQK